MNLLQALPLSERMALASSLAPSQQLPTDSHQAWCSTVPHSSAWDSFWPGLDIQPLVLGVEDEELPFPVWGCRHTAWIAYSRRDGAQAFSFTTFDGGNGWEGIETCSDWSAAMGLSAALAA